MTQITMCGVELEAFDASRELSLTKEELLKYETEQGEQRKVVIWIN